LIPLLSTFQNFAIRLMSGVATRCRHYTLRCCDAMLAAAAIHHASSSAIDAMRCARRRRS
jgi:hypothetical protein